MSVKDLLSQILCLLKDKVTPIGGASCEDPIFVQTCNVPDTTGIETVGPLPMCVDGEPVGFAVILIGEDGVAQPTRFYDASLNPVASLPEGATFCPAASEPQFVDTLKCLNT